MAEDIKNANEADDFKLFCAELNKEVNMDMELIKAGMLRYGIGHLPDALKAAIFPAPIPNGSKEETKKLGFQNLTGIKNALKAMQELNEDGKISNEQMVQFLTEKNPQSGKNIMTIVALNTYAAEFKQKRIKDKNTLELLDKNSNVMIDISETLAKLDYDEVLSKAANAVDASKPRSLKYKDLAKKSFILQNALNESLKKSGLNQSTEEQKSESEPIRMGGLPENEADTLNFSADGNKLNISAETPPENKPNDDEKAENTAQLEDSKRDSERGKKGDFNFDPVKEQDLIQYLYNVWFLGLINYVMQKAFKTLDTGLDYLCGEGQAPVRTSAAAKAAGKAGNSGNSPQNAAAVELSPEANAFAQQMSRLADATRADFVDKFGDLMKNPQRLQPMLRCIQNNIGKNPDKWQPVIGAPQKGVPFVVFDPKIHQNFAETMNEIFASDKGYFMQKITELEKDPQKLETVFPIHKDGKKNDLVKLCAHLATNEYVRKNPDKELDGNAEAAAYVQKATLIKMFDMMETTSVIFKQKENDYRVEHHLAPDAEIPPKEKLKIANSAAKELGGYYADICCEGKTLRDLQCAYHTEQDPAKKKVLEQQMKAQEVEFDKFYNHYRTPSEGERAQVQGNNKPKKSTKMGPDEAAREENSGHKKEQQWDRDIEGKKEQNAASKENNKKRKINLDRMKNRINKKHEMQQIRPQGTREGR